MKSRTSNIFAFQDLESRMLMCGTTPVDGNALALAAAPAAISAATRPHFTAAFKILGTYSSPGVSADAGKKYIFKGSCSPAGFGSMQLSGWIQTPGNLASSKAKGVLVLKNSQGTIRISVIGPTEPGFGPLPTSLSYHIKGGTGAYATAYGAGTFTDTLIVASTRFVFRF